MENEIHYMDFIQYPGRHVFVEMDKRGNNKQVKDPETGQMVTKKKKPKLEEGQFQHIGYGPVGNTIVTTKADLDKMRQNRVLLYAEINVPNYLEKEPVRKKMMLMPPPKDYVLPKPKDLSSSPSTPKIPSLLQQWYDCCAANYENGSIGLLPTCYQNDLPPLVNILQTPIGETLLHFCNFNRNKW